jgi:phosphatidylglycerophosphatase A
MNETLKKIAEFIVSCGIDSHLPLSNLWGSLLAFPALLLFRLIYYYVSPVVGIAFLGCMVFAAVISLYIVFNTAAEESPLFLIDKVLGLMLVFMHLTFTFKLMIIGVCAYHVVRVVLPFLSNRLLGFDFLRLGSTLSILLPSLLSGFLVNGFLVFVFWVAR